MRRVSSYAHLQYERMRLTQAPIGRADAPDAANLQENVQLATASIRFSMSWLESLSSGERLAAVASYRFCCRPISSIPCEG